MTELRKRSEVVGARAKVETRVSDSSDAEKEFVRSLESRPNQIEGQTGDEGQTVKVVWGAEYFQTVQYNGFTVGPFEASTTVRAGETIVDATLRLHDDLTTAAGPLRAAKANAHLEELRRLGILR